MDYTIFYKSPVDWMQKDSIGDYDVFISAYNGSDRVKSLFGAVRAKRKIWAVQPEYGLNEEELPEEGDIFQGGAGDEIGFGNGLTETLNLEGYQEAKICIDLTGFIHPNVMYLLSLLARRGLRRIECLYSEPVSYAKREDTSFAMGNIVDVRQVCGFEGSMSDDVSNDLLVIGAGYDEHLISEVAQHKDHAKKVVLLGFPSLRADMYQQSLIRINRAEDVLRPVASRRRFFAPANDPFVTAAVLQDIVSGGAGLSDITNLYLSPLSTKAQALGFVIFFLYSIGHIPSLSIVLPYSSRHEKHTDYGISRAWRYVVELP